MPGYYTGGPITLETGSILDLEADAGHNFDAQVDNLESGPTAILGRVARHATDALGGIFEAPEIVPADVARAELKRAKLDTYLKIPDAGVTRNHLDYQMWAKQRELYRQSVSSRARSTSAQIAGFGAGLAVQATDPINVASGFIPFVGEARYEAMIAKAGTSTAGRFATRGLVGAGEGALGAVVVEPINLIGASVNQNEYGLKDSFLNVVFGAFLGAGLHGIGGAVYDARMTKAMRSLDAGLSSEAFRDALKVSKALREAAANAPDEVKLQALQHATLQLEMGEPVRVAHIFAEHEAREAATRTKARETYAALRAAEIADKDPLDTYLMQRDAEIRASAGTGQVEAQPVKIELPGATLEKARVIETPAQDGSGSVRRFEISGANAPTVDGFKDVLGRLGDDPTLDEVAVRGVKEGTHLEKILQEEGFERDANGDWVKDTANGRDKKIIAETTRREEAMQRQTPTADPAAGQRVTDDVDAVTNRQGEEAAAASRTMTREDETLKAPERYNEQAAVANAYIDNLRARGLVDEGMEAELAAGDAAAARLEDEAAAYEAAAICEVENP